MRRGLRPRGRPRPGGGAGRGGGADLEFARPDPEGALATLVPRLLEAARFDARRARASAEAFARIYRPVPILPPDHYRALVLQATEGCLYNRCRFCGFYRGIEFRPKGAGEFLEHVRAARGYWGRALPARRSVFLGQANALTLGMRELETIFEIIRRELPEGLFPALARRGVDSFLDAFTGKRKSVEELRTLHRLGLHRVYIGMETAHAELLAWLRKPGSPADVVETVRRLREAGLRVGVILLAGIGGRSFAEAHVRRSVEAVRSMGLGWADRVYVSPLVNYAGSTYLDEAAKAGFEPLDDDALGEQTARLAKGIREGHGRRSGPPVAPYRVEHFVY